MKIDPNNPQALFAATTELFKGAQSALMGLLEQVPDNSKPQFEALKKKVDGVLAGLASAPTTPVPAAQEASYALNHLAHSLAYMKEMYESAVGMVDRIIKENTPKLAQLNELTTRVEKKELLTTEEVEQRVQAAKEETLQAERKRTAMLNDRRSILAGDNLPLPTDEAVLAGEEKEFAEVRKTAQGRVKALTDAGYASQLNSAELAELAYGPAAVFDKVVKIAAKAAGAPAAGEPFAGGGKPAEGTTGRKVRVC